MVCDRLPSTAFVVIDFLLSRVHISRVRACKDGGVSSVEVYTALLVAFQGRESVI